MASTTATPWLHISSFLMPTSRCQSITSLFEVPLVKTGFNVAKSLCHLDLMCLPVYYHNCQNNILELKCHGFKLEILPYIIPVF